MQNPNRSPYRIRRISRRRGPTASHRLILLGLGLGATIISILLAWLVFGDDSSSVPGPVAQPLTVATPTIRSSATLPSTALSTLIPVTAPPAARTAQPPAVPLPTSVRQTYSIPSATELKVFIDRMPLQDKVAQMVMAGFHGQSIESSPELASLVGHYHVGGLVLLESNAHDPQQLSELTSKLQELSISSGPGVPLFIAINHEGGIVVRITEGITEFPGNMAIGATGHPEYAYISAALAAQELRAMGINMNLAPVLDVNDNPLNPVIGTRSFGADPVRVAELGRLAVQGSQDNGVIAVAKHFPGHGSVDVDSHGSLPVLDASLEWLMGHELLPFSTAIRERVAGIMTAHIAIPSLDDSSRPATLSPQILTGLLRQQLGYDGLIVTDSLGMGAVSAGRGQPQAAVEAVKAGADILLSTTPLEAHIAIIQALVSAVQNGEITAERIDQSVLRILRLKYAYGLFAQPIKPDSQVVGSPEHEAIANEIARQAVTVLRDDGGYIPLIPPPARLLVISPVDLPPSSLSRGTLFGDSLRSKGYEVDEIMLNLDSPESRNSAYAHATARVANSDAVIFGEWELIKRYINQGDQWQERFIAELHAKGKPLIVVAWHNPAAILRIPEISTFLTAYGNARSQVSAVVAVLTGELAPHGQLPMDLSSKSTPK